MSSKTEETPATEEASKETESTAEFAPVVQLERVEVRTHEEQEEILFEERGKLYIYGESILNKGTGTKTWNERGIGQMKLLKHRENQKIRILMRQEKTMKVIANHIISPNLEMTPHESSETSWIWAAMDFAEGEMVEKVFCLRVKDTEKAGRFKQAIDNAKEHMRILKEGGDLPTTSEEEKKTDEAVEAIESLTVSKEGGEEKKEGGEEKKEGGEGKKEEGGEEAAQGEKKEEGSNTEESS